MYKLFDKETNKESIIHFNTVKSIFRQYSDNDSVVAVNIYNLMEDGEIELENEIITFVKNRKSIIQQCNEIDNRLIA